MSGNVLFNLLVELTYMIRNLTLNIKMLTSFRQTKCFPFPLLFPFTYTKTKNILSSLSSPGLLYSVHLMAHV